MNHPLRSKSFRPNPAPLKRATVGLAVGLFVFAIAKLFTK